MPQIPQDPARETLAQAAGRRSANVSPIFYPQEDPVDCDLTADRSGQEVRLDPELEKAVAAAAEDYENTGASVDARECFKHCG